MKARPIEKLKATNITGKGGILPEAPKNSRIHMGINKTETVFTSQISFLGPVTSMKLCISIRPQRAVSKEYMPCIQRVVV